MNDKKTLLFLGGTGAMYDAVEIAKSMGIYTIVADYYPNSPAKRVADKSYLESVMRRGAEEAHGAARRTMSKVKKKLGFVL